MIERRDPFGRTMSLRQLMDRLIDDALIVPRDEGSAGMADMTMDVFEEGDNFVVEVQVPGIKPEDIEVSVDGGMLTVRGETKREEERKERNYLIRERHMGSFRRSLRLPDTVDPDASQAKLENGVLRLTFPKSEAAKPRRIPVSAGGQRAMPADGQGNSSSGAQQGSAQARR